MPSKRLIFSLSAGLAAVAGSVDMAQAQAKLELTDPALRVPTMALRCRSTNPDSVAPHTVNFRFAEGEELHDDRVIDAVFDSAGVPRHLTVMATQEVVAGQLQTSVGVYWFGSKGAVYGYQAARAGATPNPGSAAPAAPTDTSLSDTLAAQVRSLSAWLWEHRCGVRAAVQAPAP
jgi:hypothetical protein